MNGDSSKVQRLEEIRKIPKGADLESLFDSAYEATKRPSTDNKKPKPDKVILDETEVGIVDTESTLSEDGIEPVLDTTPDKRPSILPG